MSTNVPELSTLVQAAHDIVINARRQDDLSSLTVKTVRKQVERDFMLADGTLDETSMKMALRDAVNAALIEDLEVKTAEKRKRTEEGPADVEIKSNKVKKKDKGNVTPQTDESGTAQKKKKKVAKVISDFREATSREVAEITRQSRETIATDSEDEEGIPGATASTSKTKLEAPAKSAKRSGPKSKSFVAGKKASQAVQSVDAEQKSDSELSMLIDEPPRKRRTKGKTKESTKKPGRKSKKEEDPQSALSPDEENIKKLKSFVSACGARKQWSKEFADLPLPGQQITRLKQILTDLGMTGRFSLEKAKAIKMKREISRELNDVVEFERKAGASRGERKPRASTKRIVAELDTNSEISESEPEDPESPAAKKNAASKIIQAYLANQSSDED